MVLLVIAGVDRYGLYSLFPGGGGGSYVAATSATPGPPTSATPKAYHATTHKGKLTRKFRLLCCCHFRLHARQRESR